MANGIKIGTLTFTQGYIGNTPLIAVYQGTNLIWPIPTPTPTPSPTPTPTPTPTPAPTYRYYQLGNCAGGTPASFDIFFSYINTAGNSATASVNLTNASYRAIIAQTGSVTITGGDTARAQIIDLGAWPGNVNTTKSITNLGGSVRTISYVNCSGLVDSVTFSPGQTRSVCFRNGITLPYQMYIPG